MSRVANEVWVVGEERNPLVGESAPAAQRTVRRVPSFQAYVDGAHARATGHAKQ